MKANIITIGDEILIGQIVDTNSAFIAKSLDKIGIATSEMVSISDQKLIFCMRYMPSKIKLMWLYLQEV